MSEFGVDIVRKHLQVAVITVPIHTWPASVVRATNWL